MEHLDKNPTAAHPRRLDTERSAGRDATLAFDDQRPAALAQRPLNAAVERSPRAADARAQRAGIEGSPHATAQRQQIESLFGAAVQRQAAGEEEELLQGRFATLQRQGGLEEEEPLQGKFAPLQGRAVEDEEELQRQPDPAAAVQREAAPPSAGQDGGLPAGLKQGIESLSGVAMDEVQVHYNSSRPAQLGALAHAQGKEIHVAQGQEQHLPHEAWHVVQQAQGRVRPTLQTKDGIAINDDPALEQEADVMGARAMQMRAETPPRAPGTSAGAAGGVAQRETGTIQMRLGTLDPARIPANGQVPINQATYGGLLPQYHGIHITLIPNRAGGNTVHITAYDMPNPGAGGPRTYNWYNPATGVWEGWTQGNPLTVPGNEATMLADVETTIDFYLLPAPQAAADLTAPNAFPDLNTKTPKEIEREKRELEAQLKRQAALAEKKAQREAAELLRKEKQREAAEKKAALAKLAEEKAAAEAEAKAAREAEQRAKEQHEQLLAEFADDIALGMDLADMYGWSEATVFEMAIQGAFREQIEARKTSEGPPSYIA